MVQIITQQPSFVVNENLDIGQQNWDDPDHLAVGQLSMVNLFRTVAIEPGDAVMPLPKGAELDVNALAFSDPLMPTRTLNGDTLLNRRLFNDALLVMHKGLVIHESYRNGMNEHDRHVIHSCTKSLCSMIAAMAVDEGLLDPNALMSHYIEEFKSIPAWQGVTVQHVWDMQAGLVFSEDYTDPNAEYWSYARAAGYYPPLEGETAIGARAWAIHNLTRRNYEPGTSFVYNSTLTNVLGMALENIYQKPLAELFEEKLYKKTGAQTAGYFNTDPQGFPITEGQFNLRLTDFARVASLMLNQGKNFQGEQVVPTDFVNKIITPNAQAQQAYHQYCQDTEFQNGQYKNKFWVLEPEQDRFTMLGIHGQFAWYDLQRDLMIVGFGSYPKQDGKLMMTVLKSLWDGIALATDSITAPDK